ncbi:MAG: GNAT family N-acetyltransferase [Aggregatilineales bacterium]
MTHHSEIRLDTVPIDDKAMMYRVFQLYQYDLSVYSGEEINAQGVFDYPYFDDYWIEDNRKLFLIRYNENLAGFVMLRLDIDDEVFNRRVNSIAEFFVMNCYRRTGIGEIVAQQCWSRYPGMWSLMAYTSNLPAIAFWQRTIAAHAKSGKFESKTIQNKIHFGFIAG